MLSSDRVEHFDIDIEIESKLQKEFPLAVEREQSIKAVRSEWKRLISITSIALVLTTIFVVILDAAYLVFATRNFSIHHVDINLTNTELSSESLSFFTETPKSSIFFSWDVAESSFCSVIDSIEEREILHMQQTEVLVTSGGLTQVKMNIIPADIRGIDDLQFSNKRLACDIKFPVTFKPINTFLFEHESTINVGTDGLESEVTTDTSVEEQEKIRKNQFQTQPEMPAMDIEKVKWSWKITFPSQDKIENFVGYYTITVPDVEAEVSIEKKQSNGEILESIGAYPSNVKLTLNEFRTDSRDDYFHVEINLECIGSENGKSCSLLHPTVDSLQELMSNHELHGDIKYSTDSKAINTALDQENKKLYMGVKYGKMAKSRRLTHAYSWKCDDDYIPEMFDNEEGYGYWNATDCDFFYYSPSGGGMVTVPFFGSFAIYNERDRKNTIVVQGPYDDEGNSFIGTLVASTTYEEVMNMNNSYDINITAIYADDGFEPITGKGIHELSYGQNITGQIYASAGDDEDWHVIINGDVIVFDASDRDDEIAGFFCDVDIHLSDIYGPNNVTISADAFMEDDRATWTLTAGQKCQTSHKCSLVADQYLIVGDTIVTNLAGTFNFDLNKNDNVFIGTNDVVAGVRGILFDESFLLQGKLAQKCDNGYDCEAHTGLRITWDNFQYLNMVASMYAASEPDDISAGEVGVQVMNYDDNGDISGVINMEVGWEFPSIDFLAFVVSSKFKMYGRDYYDILGAIVYETQDDKIMSIDTYLSEKITPAELFAGVKYTDTSVDDSMDGIIDIYADGGFAENNNVWGHTIQLIASGEDVDTLKVDGVWKLNEVMGILGQDNAQTFSGKMSATMQQLNSTDFDQEHNMMIKGDLNTSVATYNAEYIHGEDIMEYYKDLLANWFSPEEMDLMIKNSGMAQSMNFDAWIDSKHGYFEPLVNFYESTGDWIYLIGSLAYANNVQGVYKFIPLPDISLSVISLPDGNTFGEMSDYMTMSMDVGFKPVVNPFAVKKTGDKVDVSFEIDSLDKEAYLQDPDKVRNVIKSAIIKILSVQYTPDDILEIIVEFKEKNHMRMTEEGTAVVTYTLATKGEDNLESIKENTEKSIATGTFTSKLKESAKAAGLEEEFKNVQVDAGSVTVTPEISQSPTSAPVNASNSDDGGLGLMEIIIIVIGCLVFCSCIFGFIFFGNKGGTKIYHGSNHGKIEELT